MIRRAGRAGTALAAVAIGINPVSGLLPPTASYASIQHVIVVMQSGHSFDNYFGTRPGVSGLDLTTKPPNNPDCQPAAPGTKIVVCPNHLTAGTARSGLSDSLRVTRRSINGGKMNGFVNAQTNITLGSLAMGYLDGSDLPYYWSLANRFTLFDHFFTASQVGPLANRVEAVSGQATGIKSNAVPAGGITANTVFTQLDQKKVPWKYYVQGYNPTTSSAATSAQLTHAPVLDMPALMKTDASKVVNSSQYFVDLAKGELPAVSYVSSTTDSEQAPQSPAQGEAFVESLVNALIQSREWDHSLLLLTYDSSGGWYDNALPRTVNGVQLGLRVPAIVVSPYARSGSVDHSLVDTASIPAMIDQIFSLGGPTPPNLPSGSILSALDLNQHPISPVIGPAQGAAPALVRPAVATVYILYIGALLGTGVLIVLAFRQYRRGGTDTGAEPPDPEPVS